jgi:hypothetical protein
MINWKELEKFITPGKVCTLVIMVDGKEIGAFSFNIETLAYKEILESMPMDPVKIADKTVIASDIKKAEAERKESLKAKKSTPTAAAQKSFDAKADKALGMNTGKIEPEPLDEENEEEDNENVDEETGEIIEENKTETVKEVVSSTTAASTIGNAGVPEKRLTRAEIMAQAETDLKEPTNEQREQYEKEKQPDFAPQRGSVSAGPVKDAIVEAQKVTDQTFGEEW